MGGARKAELLQTSVDVVLGHRALEKFNHILFGDFYNICVFLFSSKTAYTGFSK